MPLNIVLIKKNQQLHSRSQYWNDNEAVPANGGFVNKANSKPQALRHNFMNIDEPAGKPM